MFRFTEKLKPQQIQAFTNPGTARVCKHSAQQLNGSGADEEHTVVAALRRQR